MINKQGKKGRRSLTFSSNTNLQLFVSLVSKLYRKGKLQWKNICHSPTLTLDEIDITSPEGIERKIKGAI